MENKYYYDLHCHSLISIDSPAKIKDIVEIAKKRGLSGVAITDHNQTYKGPIQIDGIDIIPGNEITLNDGGHLLAYFIKENIKENLGLKEAVSFIRNQGGYAVLAHPLRKEHGAMQNKETEKEVKEILDLVDGLEGGNASDSGESRRLIKEIKERHQGIPLFLTAGSDAHMAGQVGFAVVETKEKLTKKNFGKVMSEATIIVRPESDGFRRESFLLKEIVYKVGNFLRIYNLKTVRKIFFFLIIRNYFRIKNKELIKICFDCRKKT